jgi:hypothetical protein
MAVTMYHTATEYIAVPITLTRGATSSIITVGMYLDPTLTAIPAVGSFTTVTLVDGTLAIPPALAVIGEVDVMALVGPGGGSNFPSLTTTTYQIWILVITANENIIRRCDTLTVLLCTLV